MADKVTVEDVLAALGDEIDVDIESDDAESAEESVGGMNDEFRAICETSRSIACFREPMSPRC